MQNKLSPPLKSRDSSRERPSQRQRINGGSGQQSHSHSQSAAGDGQAGAGGSGAGASGGHGNEIPPEYRAEVDRIFFDFMNKICSNRKWASPVASLFSGVCGCSRRTSLFYGLHWCTADLVLIRSTLPQPQTFHVPLRRHVAFKSLESPSIATI